MATVAASESSRNILGCCIDVVKRHLPSFARRFGPDIMTRAPTRANTPTMRSTNAPATDGLVKGPKLNGERYANSGAYLV
ncbi:hypothetical protein N7537_010762 [Penicillium hordei]|uniref:Uncharacterized protein n=1 Tax=Penicillium hordei TaxID=40994 RepID=A0AAD6DM13_9EURO|nr:uncharacterized protein N7537_010762 [Penicillium hordei]KAJ5588084.1 hypothetical protein N7537_010762 [Penicillium hordei]